MSNPHSDKSGRGWILHDSPPAHADNNGDSRHQGLPASRFKYKGNLTEQNRKVTQRQFNLMIGNNMSVPVVGRLMWELLTMTNKLLKDTPDPRVIQ